jgi:uncharacterized protein (TIGR02391 family)
MKVELESLLHPRVLKHCRQLHDDGHFKHAALEAMTQVEQALKEKSDAREKFGVTLVASVFGPGRGVKLRVPFGDEMQRHAEALFKGAFSYYRNYCAHDGTKVDGSICLRVMILASELLDLLGASTVSFADVGGAPGLIKAGIFRDEDSIKALLRMLDGLTLPDDDTDWLVDRLCANGYTYSQVEALLDCGLVEYTSQDYVVEYELLDIRDTLPSTIGWFQLTGLGVEFADKH